MCFHLSDSRGRCSPHCSLKFAFFSDCKVFAFLKIAFYPPAISSLLHLTCHPVAICPFLHFIPLLLNFLSHSPHLTLVLFLYLFFPRPQLCVAVLQGTLCCPQHLSAVLRVLLLWLRLFLSSFTTTTTLYYPPLLTNWQVHALCTTCLPFRRLASPLD